MINRYSIVDGNSLKFPVIRYHSSGAVMFSSFSSNFLASVCGRLLKTIYPSFDVVISLYTVILSTLIGHVYIVSKLCQTSQYF